MAPPPTISPSAPLDRVTFLVPRALLTRPELYVTWAWLAVSSIFWWRAAGWDQFLLGASASLAATALFGFFLAQEWSIAARRVLVFRASPDGAASATHVHVVAKSVVGQPDADTGIVPLEQTGASARAGTAPAAKDGASLHACAAGMLRSAPRRFTFRAAVFEVDGGRVGGATITALPVPDSEQIGAYASWRGWERDDSAAAVLKRFGSNKIEVPMPAFFTLVREHAVAPFFVFQIGVTLLWCLDDYIYYSLFQFGLLFFMEGMLIFQRAYALRRFVSASLYSPTRTPTRSPPSQVW
jgi:hypothetical protein